VKLELGKEYPPPDEQTYTDNLIRRLREKMERDYGSGHYLGFSPRKNSSILYSNDLRNP